MQESNNWEDWKFNMYLETSMLIPSAAFFNMFLQLMRCL